MYNPILDTFLAVAEDGSFTKAGERLYLSPTAVMKQINTLEKELGLTLFFRRSSGVILTPAGDVILREAKKIKEECRQAIAEARAKEATYDTTFCVGTSLLNPAKPFMDVWYSVNPKFPDYKLHLVPFDDKGSGILSEIRQLGTKFDFLVGVCNSKTWLSMCNFTKLGTYRIMIAVPREHRLAKKEVLTLDDLHGETLMIVPQGDSGTNDAIRKLLTDEHPQINLTDTQRFYDLSVFSRCAESGNLLLTVECWSDVHPGLVTLPVDWNFTIPYGILFAKDAPSDVFRFAHEAEKQYAKNSGAK